MDRWRGGLFTGYTCATGYFLQSMDWMQKFQLHTLKFWSQKSTIWSQSGAPGVMWGKEFSHTFRAQSIFTPMYIWTE